MWKKIDSIPLYKPIAVTDGKTVYIGRIVEMRHGTAFFEGVDLKDGKYTGLTTALLTGWKNYKFGGYHE